MALSAGGARGFRRFTIGFPEGHFNDCRGAIAIRAAAMSIILLPATGMAQ